MSNFPPQSPNMPNGPVRYEYRVVPFVGNIRSGIFSSEGSDKVAQQLQEAINLHAAQGWEYYHVSEVDVAISTGCLAGLFGVKSGSVTFNQIVFRRQVNF